MMSYKNTLEQTLCLIFTLISVSAMAMDLAPKPSRFVSKTLQALIPTQNPMQMRPVTIKVEIELPESVQTEEEKLAYFTSRQPETKEKVSKVLQAYLTTLTEQSELILKEPLVDGLKIELLKIVPTHFDFNPDLQTFLVRRVWGEQTLQEGLKADLEGVIHCIYDQEKGTLIAGPYSLQIFPEDKKNLTVSMEILRAMYPERDSLKIRPETRRAINVASCVLAMQKGLELIRIGAIDHTSQLPLPDEYFDSVLIEDLKKLAAFYVVKNQETSDTHK